MKYTVLLSNKKHLVTVLNQIGLLCSTSFTTCSIYTRLSNTLPSHLAILYTKLSFHTTCYPLYQLSLETVTGNLFLCASVVDAPENWTSRAEDAFIHLCCLCKEMSLEHGKMSTAVSDLKRKRLKVKVLNLLSVYSVHWLTKSEKQVSCFC